MTTKITKNQLKEHIIKLVAEQLDKPTDVLSLEVLEKYIKEATIQIRQAKFLAVRNSQSKNRITQESYKQSLREIKSILQHAIDLIENIGGR